MIPYSRQLIDKKDIQSVNKVLRSNFLTQGKQVLLFEKKICEKVGAKYSISVNSATSALHISCLALGLCKNDIFWTVPNTYVASANSGIMCGAKVDFVDIDKNTFNICPDQLESKLQKAKKINKLPKILIPVDFAGNPYNQEKIYELSRKYKFKIVEDASHALGSTYKKKIIGNGKWSDITVFSFHPVKPITTAEGGIAVTNNKLLYEKMNLLRSHGVTKNKIFLRKKNMHNWYYEQKILGFNYRMNEIQAALGISQIKKLHAFNRDRNLIAERYKLKFDEVPIRYQLISRESFSSYHLFIINFPNTKKVMENYNKIFGEFYKKRIAVMLHYFPVHLQPFYRRMGFKAGDFPVSENYAKRSFSIPNFPGLTLNKQKKIIQSVINIYKKYS